MEAHLQLLVDKGYLGVLDSSADDVTGYFAANIGCSIESAPKSAVDRVSILEVCAMSSSRFAICFKSLAYVTLTALVLLLVNQSVFAQVDEGSISGLVQDPTGAVVPGAQVTLLNTDQGITLNTTTTSAGEYTFSPVRIGHYTVTAIAPGFSKTEQENLQVTLDAHLQVNIALKTWRHQ